MKTEREEILVNVRVIELKTGLVISAGQVIIPRYLICGADLAVARK
jgi:hypothetical protein